ncbi:MAG: hypothetical protein QXN05_03940 [Acidilobaceae archaeon]
MQVNEIRALVKITAVSSALASLLVLYALVTELVSYKGQAISGHISLLGYELEILGTEVRVPPLDSVRKVSLVVGVIAFLNLASVTAGLYRLARRRELEAVEFLASSALISALALTLLYSLLRVVANDVLPALPTLGSFTTLAGILKLEKPIEEKSLVFVVYEKAGFLLFLWAIFSLVLAFVLVYVLLKSSEAESQANSLASLTPMILVRMQELESEKVR